MSLSEDDRQFLSYLISRMTDEIITAIWNACDEGTYCEPNSVEYNIKHADKALAEYKLNIQVNEK